MERDPVGRPGVLPREKPTRPITGLPNNPAWFYPAPQQQVAVLSIGLSSTRRNLKASSIVNYDSFCLTTVAGRASAA